MSEYNEQYNFAISLMRSNNILFSMCGNRVRLFSVFLLHFKFDLLSVHASHWTPHKWSLFLAFLFDFENQNIMFKAFVISQGRHNVLTLHITLSIVNVIYVCMLSTQNSFSMYYVALSICLALSFVLLLVENFEHLQFMLYKVDLDLCILGLK